MPLRGRLMPEVAAQLRRIFDAVLSPRVDGVAFGEPMSPACARHVACSGGIQRVMVDARGRIVRLGTGRPARRLIPRD